MRACTSRYLGLVLFGMAVLGCYFQPRYASKYSWVYLGQSALVGSLSTVGARAFASQLGPPLPGRWENLVDPETCRRFLLTEQLARSTDGRALLICSLARRTRALSCRLLLASRELFSCLSPPTCHSATEVQLFLDRCWAIYGSLALLLASASAALVTQNKATIRARPHGLRNPHGLGWLVWARHVPED